MKVLREEFKQRSYDGKWEHLVMVNDYDNQYHYADEHGKNSVLLPKKWLTVNVYDFLVEMEV